jgi:hypothetical protein
MHKQSIVVIAVSLALAGGYGFWKYSKSKKAAEVSLAGPIGDSDKTAKPSQAQCTKFADDLAHHVEPDQKEMFRTTKGGQEAICKDKFSIATLKCVGEHQDKNEIVKNLTDPYGCLAEYPRK